MLRDASEGAMLKGVYTEIMFKGVYEGGMYVNVTCRTSRFDSI